MMEALFLKIINMSITATYVFLAILILRLLLKRAPKSISFMLWSVLLFRLVCPVSFSSVFSLFNHFDAPAAVNGGIEYIPSDIGFMNTPQVNVGIKSVGESINNALPQAAEAASVNPMQIFLFIGSCVWIAGIVIMLIYSVASYVKLKRRLSTATLLFGNVFETDEIASPFVCGFFRPKIYLPVGIDGTEREYVLRHERTHILRKDHIVKPFAFLVLSVHWFNPFMWLAFWLMSRDMEMSCDERVVRELDRKEKAGYSVALVQLAMKRPGFTGSPLAFGEGGMRARVKNVLNYKRPAFWAVCVAAAVAVAAGVCLISNPGKDADHMAQKKAKEIKNSEVPNFEELYADTVEIDVSFDPDGMYSGLKTIKIKDGKIISDILTMIGESHAITDGSQIGDMSGMASRNNSLILVAKDGGKKEIKFAFDDPAFAVGYLEIDEKEYDPGFTFFRYIADFAEYREFDTNIDSQVEELFGKYNWTVDYRVASSNMTLPANLKHEAGEFPVKIYWAYNKELSKNIGLDYSSCLGKEVQVDIYRLREPLPEYMSPRMNSRGVVLKYDNKIVGAYIDAGRHDSFACSLDRQSLKDITGKEWDSWVSEYINYGNELEMKLSGMKPEDVIKQYYAAMDSHDQKMLFACLTRQNLCGYLTVNMDNNQLINKGFKNAYIDGEQNVKSAKLIGLREMSVAGNSKDIVEYEVTIDYKFYKEMTSSSGKQPRFVILRKESDKSGWRIQSEGTGP